MPLHRPPEPLPEHLVGFSRSLRKNQTQAERKLWRYLRDRRVMTVKFRRQHVIGGYILDFFCAEANLTVEVDGGQHGLPEQAEYDRRRTEYLEGLGIKVLRFWANDVLGSRVCWRRLRGIYRVE